MSSLSGITSVVGDVIKVQGEKLVVGLINIASETAGEVARDFVMASPKVPSALAEPARHVAAKTTHAALHAYWREVKNLSGGLAARIGANPAAERAAATSKIVHADFPRVNDLRNFAADHGRSKAA